MTQAVEAALLAAGRALSVEELVALFEEEAVPPTRREIRDSIEALRELWEGRALELAEVSSGFRMQVRASHSRWMTRLWAERPPRYTRALLETLALIAYRQPITRGQIEDVRGVSVSTSIVKTLLEREWVRVVGHREVPGRPALYGTTRTFLDHFNLKSLEELPALQEVRDIEGMVPDLFRAVPVPALGPDRGDGATLSFDGDGQSQPGEAEGEAGESPPGEVEGEAGDSPPVASASPSPAVPAPPGRESAHAARDGGSASATSLVGNESQSTGGESEIAN